MSPKHIITLVVLGLANLCVLGLGCALLLTPPAAQPVATAVPLEAAVKLTASALPGDTPTSEPATERPVPPSLTPTTTSRPTLTHEPSRTPYPTFVFTSTATPTPTRIPSATRPPATPTRPSATGSTSGAGGSGAAREAPSNRVSCGTPNGQPTNGKLDVFWSYIAWEAIPNTDNVRGTIEIIPSGGDDCYKYNFMGNTYDYEPLTFIARKCAGTPVNLTVTSRDGQRWSQDWIIEVGPGQGFKCK